VSAAQIRTTNVRSVLVEPVDVPTVYGDHCDVPISRDVDKAFPRTSAIQARPHDPIPDAPVDVRAVNRDI
jgi:hypothetical protein